MKQYLMTKENISRNQEESNQDGQSMLFELLKEEGFRRVCRALEHAIGTAEASLYSELLGRRDYFRKRGQLDNEGYFFNTVLDLQHGTALTDKRQRTIIKRLEQLGLIKTKLKDLPPKRYFQINDDESILNEYLLQGKAIMDRLEKQKESQKQRIEQDKNSREGDFSPVQIKSSHTADFKSSILADSNITKGQTNKNKCNKNKKERGEPEKSPAHSKPSNNQKTLNKLIAIWKDIYNQHKGHKPTLTAKDTKALEKLLINHGFDHTEVLLNEYINHANEKESKEAGYPLSWLPGAANRLLLERAEREEAKNKKMNNLITQILYEGYEHRRDQINQLSESDQAKLVEIVEHNAELDQWKDIVSTWRNKQAVQ